MLGRPLTSPDKSDECAECARGIPSSPDSDDMDQLAADYLCLKCIARSTPEYELSSIFICDTIHKIELISSLFDV